MRPVIGVPEAAAGPSTAEAIRSWNASTSSAGSAIATYWVSPAPPIPSDLADHELARRCGADHQLHDPAALLGGHAGRDPHPVDQDRQEHEDDEDRPDEAAAGDLLLAHRAAVARRRGGRLEVELRRLERVELGVVGEVRGPVEDREADGGEADQLGARRVGDARRPERRRAAGRRSCRSTRMTPA